MKVILVGMPGCGKSTVGRSLARRLGLPFVDADTVVEERIGCSIRDYFEYRGEAAFRDIEEQVIDELTQGPASVLATGGGVVLREANRQRLHERGTVIYLRSSVDRLYRRLRRDTKRPLLQVDDPLARLRDLFNTRDPLYRAAAHFVIDTHGRSRAMLMGSIIMQLELMDKPLASPPDGSAQKTG